MKLTIEITALEQAWLSEQAALWGLSADEIIHKMIGERLASGARPPAYKTVEEQIRAMDELAEMNRGCPTLPDEAFDRESIYDDRL